MNTHEKKEQKPNYTKETHTKKQKMTHVKKLTQEKAKSV